MLNDKSLLGYVVPHPLPSISFWSTVRPTRCDEDFFQLVSQNSTTTMVVRGDKTRDWRNVRNPSVSIPLLFFGAESPKSAISVPDVKQTEAEKKGPTLYQQKSNLVTGE